MSELMQARLVELEEGQDPAQAKNGGRVAVVQFNPESLKVSYANQVVDPPKGAKTQSEGSVGRQFVGRGSTKLSLQLWFDVTAPVPAGVEEADDVRRLTQKVSAFMKPEPSKLDSKTFVPPMVRFLWGSFSFDGLVESLEETLEYFSPLGVPLRASMSLSMSQQKILFNQLAAGSPAARRTPGAAPMATAAQGSTVQGLAAAAGQRGRWQDIASANGIENPRALAAGLALNLNVGVKLG